MLITFLYYLDFKGSCRKIKSMVNCLTNINYIQFVHETQINNKLNVLNLRDRLLIRIL